MRERMRCDWHIAPDQSGSHPALADPWELAATAPDGVVLAVLTATFGPTYRDAGAAMAILPDGRFAGSITSGCVEADLILRAEEVRTTGAAQHLHYGQGSPFFDLRLPCGGAVIVTLFLLRDPDCLADLATARADRRAVSLRLDPAHRLRLGPWQPTGAVDADFVLGFRPAMRLAIFGAGPEALVFAKLAGGMGYDHLLISHEDSMLDIAAHAGCRVLRLDRLSALTQVGIDSDTAAVLFYHDHDYEPELLRFVLGTPAFYIGAQGGRATQTTRLRRLRDLGLAADALARVRGPIGLIHSSRDPRTLAVSVMAEIVGLRNEAAADLVLPSS